MSEKISEQAVIEKQPLAELLDEAPAVLRKPLSLINGQSYAAIWPYVKVSNDNASMKSGNGVKSEQRLFIVREDGKVFGTGGDHPLNELALEIRLPEIPPAEKLWSVTGVKAFRQGNRPKPADGFNRITDVIDRFIDFDHSLASQRTMSELISCYIMATWFLDAFNVVGFLWPNGERGSGKTQLLTLIAELSYLGQVILAGGSYASLRDMADYGATLCFDDAENLADPKRTDPDKRTLLLAGNRKGNTVPLKEAISEKGWRTRYINTFCARAFSAIQMPDPVLASRTIIVPLIRTPDRYRANADPLEYTLWPHDRRELIDDLWALSLSHLALMPCYERAVNQQAKLTGRNLEPWRALLACALWLDEHGVSGLWERLSELSVIYQRERRELEREDLPVLIIRALCRLTADLKQSEEESAWSLKVADIAEEVRRMAEERELDMDIEQLTTRRVGRVMGTMRFRTDSKASRPSWLVTAGELQRWLSSLGITEPETHHDEVSEQDEAVSESTDALGIEERLKLAAVLEFDGGLSREMADRLAGISLT